MQPTAAPPPRRTLWPVIVMVTVLLLLVLFGGPAVGILAAIAFPPGPPLPPDTTEIAHQNPDYGVDEWTLLTHQAACDVAQFYMSQGGSCSFPASDSCPSESIGSIAQCSGVSPYSIFALRWEVSITTNDIVNHEAQLQLKREMLWSGMPPPTSPPES